MPFPALLVTTVQPQGNGLIVIYQLGVRVVGTQAGTHAMEI